MRLRQNYPISDRIRLLLILIFFLLVMTVLAHQKYIENHTKNQNPTMEEFLAIALEPVGNTMYIWGGGWDEEDQKAGASSARIGLSPIWAEFTEKQDETYNFENHRFERENGLDCSGYVGWVVYNLFETKDGQQGYVTTSTDMAENFAKRGWGELLLHPKEFLVGDIVSMDGHVWISLGTCADGSVLLVHSSPPGVSVCGTPIPKQDKSDISEMSLESNSEKSIAVQLAEEFMTMYYPKWQEKYPNRCVSDTYLEDVTVMRWNSETLSNALEWQQKSGEEVLHLFK